ncbi:hypothetical protein QW060_25450 [Myroides ceti]|uniref:Uncharacterized protein n=1 Tax=Paenimyroides ceti TaxID=395087 RepID=A0ABT8D2Y5_9FLAO|nr:hypothetical protein [Paenimyroides ceti]MDN3710217.1 hypothetical protein [Paenimyroides ceti]
MPFLLINGRCIIAIIFIQGNYLNWLKQTFHTNELNDFTPISDYIHISEFLKKLPILL